MQAADTANQLILVYGIRKSVKTADSKHPYGYSNMPYVSSLISGVGIFCMGAGLSGAQLNRHLGDLSEPV